MSSCVVWQLEESGFREFPADGTECEKQDLFPSSDKICSS